MYITIFVETLTGTRFQLYVSSNETILSLKSKIQRLEGIPIVQQHLIWRDEDLDNRRLVKDCSIVDSSTIKMVVKLRGGPLNARRLLPLRLTASLPPPPPASWSRSNNDLPPTVEAAFWLPNHPILCHPSGRLPYNCGPVGASRPPSDPANSKPPSFEESNQQQQQPPKEESVEKFLLRSSFDHQTEFASNSNELNDPKHQLPRDTTATEESHVDTAAATSDLLAFDGDRLSHLINRNLRLSQHDDDLDRRLSSSHVNDEDLDNLPTNLLPPPPPPASTRFDHSFFGAGGAWSQCLRRHPDLWQDCDLGVGTDIDNDGGDDADDQSQLDDYPSLFPGDSYQYNSAGAWLFEEDIETTATTTSSSLRGDETDEVEETEGEEAHEETGGEEEEVEGEIASFTIDEADQPYWLCHLPLSEEEDRRFRPLRQTMTNPYGLMDQWWHSELTSRHLWSRYDHTAAPMPGDELIAANGSNEDGSMSLNSRRQQEKQEERTETMKATLSDLKMRMKEAKERKVKKASTSQTEAGQAENLKSSLPWSRNDACGDSSSSVTQKVPASAECVNSARSTKPNSPCSSLTPTLPRPLTGRLTSVRPTSSSSSFNNISPPSTCGLFPRMQSTMPNSTAAGAATAAARPGSSSRRTQFPSLLLEPTSRRPLTSNGQSAATGLRAWQQQPQHLSSTSISSGSRSKLTSAASTIFNHHQPGSLFGDNASSSSHHSFRPPSMGSRDSAATGDQAGEKTPLCTASHRLPPLLRKNSPPPAPNATTSSSSLSSNRSSPPASGQRKHCSFCYRRIGIVNNYPCRCGRVFCSVHRYAEAHSCKFDYKAEARRNLLLANPVINPPKLPRI